MENITLLQIAETLGFIVGIIGSVIYLKGIIKKCIENTLIPINKKIDNMEMDNLKTALVNFMVHAEFGQTSEEQNLNAHELYDKYQKKGGNSYIHEKWESLKKEGKI